MNTLLQDLRYGFRMLLKQKALTAVALLSLALGIGANTALFSIVDAMLLKMLPVREPERLVLFKFMAPQDFSVGSYNGSGHKDEATGLQVKTSFPYQTYQRLREQPGPLSDLFAFGSMNFNISADGQADLASGQAVSGNYYTALGVQPATGRLLTDEDDKANATPVAVLSHRYWQKRFNGDPAIAGKQINLNNVAFTVVGVSAKGFDGTAGVGSTQEVTIPIALEPQLYADKQRSYLNGPGVWWLRLMGRMKPGVTREQVQSQLENTFLQSVIEHRAARQAAAKAAGGNAIGDLDPKQYPRLYADPGGQGELYRRTWYAPSLYLLLGVVGLVLLIACANVANLLLSRAAGRQKEIGLRLALGASRWRLMRQLLTESVLLAFLGGLLGILFAVWIKDGLIGVSLWGGRGMASLEPRLDWRVLGFTFGLSLLTGIVFGLAPAWRTTRVDLTPSLKESGRTSSAAHRSLLGRGLVVVQVALSLILLVGAGLFVRTLLNLQRVDTGFNTKNLLLFEIQPGLTGYKDERLVQLYPRISERLETIPGVQAVTFSRMALISGSIHSSSIYLREALNATPNAEGSIPESGEVYRHVVRENFLDAIGIPLLAGRTLSPQDNSNSPKVAVVNQTFANKYFPNQSAIGQRFTYNPKKPDEIEIVGVCRDAKYSSLRDDVPPTMYSSFRQERTGALSAATFEVRTAGDPSATVASVRDAVRQIDSNLPVLNVKTQIEQADETLRMERLFAKLLTLFALLAQQLAAIGLFGVLAYTVSQRTHEIGIRMALGANRGNVLKMIVRQGMVLAVIGVVLGLVGAYVLTKYLESWVGLSKMLFEVKVSDPLTYATIAVLLTVVALIACYIPARRATKVDPLVALRYE
ncbi:MAG TPA: ABC transporter permease [Pyrinomonadaceae bacterium]|nr:ABC transporter permease [Pyrinomonadaceae bacterium]